MKNKLQSYSFTTGDGSKRDVEFLGIEEYPAFIVFDHEAVVLKTYDQEEFLTFLENY